MPQEVPSKPEKTILVIEDEESIRQLLDLALSTELPYTVVVQATNGYGALSIAQSIKCDLFIIHYLLPQMNGIQLYNQLRALPAYRETPVLFITGSPETEALEQRHLPVLEKPFSIDALLAAVTKLLSQVPPI